MISTLKYNWQSIRPLPEDWEWKTLKDVVGSDGVFIDGDWIESKDQDQNGDIRLIQLADLGDGYYRNRSNRFLTYKKALELGCTFLEKDDLLIARMPDPLGRACIFPGDVKRSITVVDVCIVRTKNAEHRWLMHAVNAPQFRADVESLQSGSTRKRISRKNLAKLKLPIPPLPVQERIVGQIEELFSDLDAGVGALERVRTGLKRYKASVLKAACEGKLLASRGVESSEGLPEGWRWVKLDDVTENFDGKRVPVKASDREKMQGEYPYYGASGIIDYVNEYLFDGDYLLIAEDGANLLSRSTPIAFQAHGKFWVNNHAHVVLTTEECLLTYLEISLNSFDLRFYITGTAQPKLTQVNMNKIPVPLPPLDEQQRIVAEVDRRLSVVREVESAVEAGLARAGRLRQSVLRSAFEGRLVQGLPLWLSRVQDRDKPYPYEITKL